MKRKLAPSDFALWAALPMAHTSKIEGRLTRILDGNRCHSLPRHALVLAASLGTAALVPLAMLMPTAKAQTAPAVLGEVQLIGVRDVNVHHVDHRWWQANGLLLTGAEPHVALSQGYQKDLFSSTNVRDLMFAFHLPTIHNGETVAYAPAGSLKDLYQADTSKSLWTLEATFPLSQKTATVQVGIAAHPWGIVAAHAPIRSAGTGISSAYGNVVFSPIEHYPGNIWIVTVTIDQPKRDQPKQDWRVVAVNAQGQKVYPVSTGDSSTPTRLHLIACFDKSVSAHHIRQFQVETRPFVWTEFNSIALQPVRP